MSNLSEYVRFLGLIFLHFSRQKIILIFASNSEETKHLFSANGLKDYVESALLYTLHIYKEIFILGADRWWRGRGGGRGGADSEVLMGTQILLNQIIAINQSGPAPHSLHTYISKIIKSTRQKGIEGKDHRNRIKWQVPVCVLHIVRVVPTINVPVFLWRGTWWFWCGQIHFEGHCKGWALKLPLAFFLRLEERLFE